MANLDTFRQLGLSEDIIKALEKKGFESPSKIQEKTIPVFLTDERDIIGQAQTGTGKTAAFGLPMIEKMQGGSDHVQAIVLTPTRELTMQVSSELNSFKGEKKLKIVPIYGGQSIEKQRKQLSRQVDIVVGTPGRIIDHIRSGKLDLSQIDFAILDEADEMLTIGFIEDIQTILSHTNPNKKTLLFSATMSKPIVKLAEKYMKDYVIIQAKSQELTTDLTDQIYFEVKESHKLEALCRIMDIEATFYGLIFCRTKRDVDMIAEKLMSRGYEAEALHGDLSQHQRERVLDKFRKKVCTILVVTDVASRGLDITDLTHVINFALPQDPESYVHRIGRTGRAGKSGVAVTFITPSEYYKLMRIQKKTKSEIRKENLPSVKEIIASRKERIRADLDTALESAAEKPYQAFADSLLEGRDPATVVAALLKLSFEDQLRSENYKEIRSQDVSVDRQGKTRLFVAKGKLDNMSPRSLVDYIEKRTQVGAKRIQGVQVFDKFSFINVSFVDAETIINAFKSKGRRGRSLVVLAKKK